MPAGALQVPSLVVRRAWLDPFISTRSQASLRRSSSGDSTSRRALFTSRRTCFTSRSARRRGAPRSRHDARTFSARLRWSEYLRTVSTTVSRASSAAPTWISATRSVCLATTSACVVTASTERLIRFVACDAVVSARRAVLRAFALVLRWGSRSYACAGRTAWSRTRFARRRCACA